MKRIQQLCTTGILLLLTLTAVAQQQVSKPRIVVGHDGRPDALGLPVPLRRQVW
ncbi:hypothetical protein [Chitinophaga sp. OAE865]|uniref:hypothetical protein n=1 Tax=Chitinophaga sp. OAE865 TaxID=2817898 RepID=UPI00339AC35D